MDLAQNSQKSVPSATLLLGDCLAIMPTLATGSVDTVFADLPYNVTRCVWDVAIDQSAFWAAMQPLLAPSAALVATTDVRLAASLIDHCPIPFRYDLVWHKSRAVGFLNANSMPLRAHELILYFAERNAPYTVQKKRSWRNRPSSSFKRVKKIDCYGKADKIVPYVYGDERYPTSVLEPESPAAERGLHPTQKPVDLLAWLIKAYSLPGQTLLDPTMGSGSAGVACMREGRNFIGIERDPAYFAIAQQRIEAERQALAKAVA